MAEISASRVMELRQRTGLGMMECKKALSEAAGDMTKAEELLRIKSGAKASKAADRIASEGVIGLYVAPDGKTAAIVEVNCETDFVGKNDDFKAFAAEVAKIAAVDAPADLTALAAKTLASGETIEARRVALVQKIGENLSLRRFARRVAQGRIASYVQETGQAIHGTVDPARLSAIRIDIGSLNEYLGHITNKIQFLLDATLGFINIEQNNGIKVLTVVSVVGVPPTLVASIYGMNFKWIPELQWEYGYFYGLAVILLSALLPLWWFKRRGWI